MPNEMPLFGRRGRRVGSPGGGGMPPTPPMGGGGAPPGPPGPPPGAPAPAGNEWQPGTPYEAGQSVAGGDLAGQAAMMNFQSENERNLRRKNRADWSDADWSSNLERALRPQTRQDQKGGWEYLFKGGWVPQSQWDDPMWRQNVYDPYEADVRNYWRDTQEASRKWAEGRSPNPGYRQIPTGGGRRRGGGVRSGRGGGGGGGNYDPAMIEALLGG